MPPRGGCTRDTLPPSRRVPVNRVFCFRTSQEPGRARWRPGNHGEARARTPWRRRGACAPRL